LSRTGELTLRDVFADCRSRNKCTRILLIADQFEEAYTSVENEGLRHRFIDTLLAGFSDSAPRGSTDICLILTLRGDFYGRALRHRPLADALQGHVENLGPMNRKELEAAIRRPAEILKVSFEPGLVETLLDDIENKPGSLPLLQFALREMWGRQAKRKIMRKSYDAIGGVKRALAQRAETIFAAMTGNSANPQIIQAFRRLFTRLVTLGEGQQDTRRVVDRRELGDEVWSLAQRLAGEDNRLVVTNAPAFSCETAEVAHEALIRHWPKLVDWIGQDRTFQTWLRQIRSSVELWSADPSDDGPLLRGGMLAQARDWLAQRRDDFSAAELGYIEASIALQQLVNEEREAARQAEIRRQQELAEAAVKLATEQRRRARIAVVGGIVAFALAVVAIVGGYEAYVERDKARVLLMAAEAPLLVNKSDFLLKNEPGKIDLAALLAVQAMRMRPSVDAAQSLGNALDLLPRRLVFQADGFNQKSVAFSPDGQYVAFASSDGATQLRSLKTGETIPLLPEGSPTHLVQTLAITASTGEPGAAFLSVKQKDPEQEGKSPMGVSQATSMGGTHRIYVLEDNYFPAAFDPTSEFLATTQGDSTVRIWSLKDFEVKYRLSHTEPVRSVLFSPRGKTLVTIAASEPSGATSIQLWQTDTWQSFGHISASGPISAICLSADGGNLAIGFYNGKLSVFSLNNLQEILSKKAKGAIFSLAFSPSGDVVATADMQGFVNVYRLSDGNVELSAKHSGYVTAVSFSPDGSLLATAGYDGVVRLLDYQAKVLKGEMKHGSEVTSLEFSDDGRYLVSASLDHSSRVWEIFDRREVARMPHNTYTAYAVFSPGTRYVATTDMARRSWVWEIGYPAEPAWSSHVEEGQVYEATDSSAYALVRIGRDGKSVANAYDGDAPKASIPLPSPVEDVWVGSGGTVLVARSGKRAYIWNFDSGELVDQVPAEWNVAVSPSGKYVATDWDGKSACIQEVGRQRPLQCFNFKNEHPRNALQFSDDEKYLLSVETDKAILRDVATGREQRAFDAKSPEQFVTGSLSRDGKLLAIVSGKAVVIWNLPSDRKILSFPDDYNIYNVAFSPDGRYLASESGDPYKSISITRVWNLETGQEVNRRDPGFGERRISFSRDGRILIAQGRTTHNIWLWRPDDLIKETCVRVHRNLTPEEWKSAFNNLTPEEWKSAYSVSRPAVCAD
jgi:WD40 repeat protein